MKDASEFLCFFDDSWQNEQKKGALLWHDHVEGENTQRISLS